MTNRYVYFCNTCFCNCGYNSCIEGACEPIGRYIPVTLVSVTMATKAAQRGHVNQ